MSYSKEELSAYRLAKAKESLEEAYLLASAEHWNTVANRLYYACFYAASAYLVLDEIQTGTHNGVKSLFNQKVISSGLADASCGQLYNKLFSLRQDADYRDFKDVEKERIKPFLDETNRFLDVIATLIKQKM